MPFGVAREFIAAGDIASCSSDGDEATAGLLDSIDGTVAALGDNAYESGRRASSLSATTRAGVVTRRAPSPRPATTTT